HTHLVFFFYDYGTTHNLHSFPTRRSSDLYGSTRPGRWLLAGALLGLAMLMRWQLATYGLVAAGEAALTVRREGLLRNQPVRGQRSEEHTSELQSRGHLVCRLLLEKKKIFS